jgi:hypothetical protein
VELRLALRAQHLLLGRPASLRGGQNGRGVGLVEIAPGRLELQHALGIGELLLGQLVLGQLVLVRVLARVRQQTPTCPRGQPAGKGRLLAGGHPAGLPAALRRALGRAAGLDHVLVPAKVVLVRRLRARVRVVGNAQHCHGDKPALARPVLLPNSARVPAGDPRQQAANQLMRVVEGRRAARRLRQADCHVASGRAAPGAQRLS